MKFWNQCERSSKVNKVINVVAEGTGTGREVILVVEAEVKVVVGGDEVAEVVVLVDFNKDKCWNLTRLKPALDDSFKITMIGLQ